MNKRIIVVKVNSNGHVELTTEELEKMINEAYNDGYSDGSSTQTITYPSWKYYTATTPSYGYSINVTSSDEHQINLSTVSVDG